MFEWINKKKIIKEENCLQVRCNLLYILIDIQEKISELEKQIKELKENK